MKRLLALFIALIFSINMSLRADEGMWLLPLLEQLNMGKMTELGLELTAEEIYSLNQPSIKDAIVIFGGGCTAEIVSSQGLLLTNHHCGYGVIQSHSTVEHDYLTDGFWAMSKDEELPNPGLSVTFLVKIEDVTDRVLKDVTNDMTESERADVINSVRGEIVREATEGNHYRANVNAFFGGNNYYLLVYEIYNDVRLVGAPPSSIGKFGHDTDNWEWPRHTGDFSVFRVYMGPDGKPAEYSEDNVPLKPRYHLPVSAKGIDENDFAMILGYPGGTQRYMTSYGVDEVLSITHPNRIKIRGIRQEILMADMMADPRVNIQYASKYSGSSNYWKFSIGQKQGLERLNVKGEKEELEKRFTEWVNKNRERKQLYGDALELIKTSIEGRAEYNNAQQYLSECLLRGTELPSMARNAQGLVSALSGDNEEETNEAVRRLKGRAEGFYKDYNPPTDRKATKAMIKVFKEDIDPVFWPDFVTQIDQEFGGDVDKYVDCMFDNSIFTTEDKLMNFLTNPDAEKLENDPAMKAGMDIFMVLRDLMQKSAEFDTNLEKGRRLYIAGLREMDPEIVRYPDANFTMRLTYGSVLPYQPKDAVIYKHYTTMEGVMEKYVPGDYEFDLPDRLFELYEQKKFGKYADPDGHMPICFLTNNDITGGNSGSPVLNGKGELIGLAFDGNWEAMSGDVAFEPDLQRCINVDIRYVLWIMDIYAGAGHLVKEMDIRE
ncbi:MAG: S46 family peptidase [Bacteroidales bacterium]|nr:S46 family peptidase [Bacteroidales bacterium]